MRGPTRRAGAVTRIENGYVAWLRVLLRRRATVLAVTAALFAGALLLWPLIPVELAPMTDANEIDIDVELAPGSNIAVVRAYVEEVEDRVREIVAPGDVYFVSTEVRGGDAEVELALVPQNRRERSSIELADELRETLDGTIPGAEISVDAQPGLWILRRVFSSGGGEDALEIELRGWDLERADRVADEIRRRLEAVEGLTDVRVRRDEGRPEETLILARERIAELGLTVAEVTRTIQANVGGVEAGRFKEGGREYPIIVRLRPDDRLSRSDLDNVSLRTPDGVTLPLAAVVEARRTRGPTEIERVDGQRVTYISAGLEAGTALGDVVERAREELSGLALPAGFSLLFGGEYQEQLEARRDFIVAIAMALVLVYMVMAAQFERFIDPLIVMISVPVALIGVVPALLLTGTTLNIQSVMGLVMLIGIVVNNAIVLIDAINLLRRERGFAAEEAVLEAARLRLRPILMTTLTTVLGLSPLALGIGTGAEIQAALARVVVGGLVASTLVTLVLIPTTYISVEVWRTRERSVRVRASEVRAAAQSAGTLS
jgi:HAE1 family hydrophobic/amphiphilic exporter-1